MQQEIEQLDKLSTLLDSKFRLPGTSLRFGWDTLVGLIPGVGDAVALLPAGFLIFRAYSMGARKRTLMRMIVNTGLDTTLGAVPVLGDVFDLFYKSNNRNMALLRDELALQADV